MTHTQAWCWHAPGEPDQLTLTRQALPTPGPDEVLVANRIIAFNPVDWKLIEQGHPHWQPGHVPGVDGMGTLVALGPMSPTCAPAPGSPITPTCATAAALPATPWCRLAP